MRRRGFLRLAAMGGTALATSSVVPGCSDRRPSTAGLPTSAEMMAWIEEIVAQGIRRPGYAADRWIEGWAADRFRAFGLEDVALEPVDLDYYAPLRGELILEPDEQRFPGFPMPHSRPGVVAAELARLEGSAVGGRIAVGEFAPLVLPQNGARALATSFHDPAGEFDTLQQVLPFNFDFNSVMEPAIEAGASAFVGLLTGFPWDTHDYYVPYDAIARPIPGLWLSGSNGRRLLDILAGQPVRGRVEVEAERRPIVSRSVTGVLPGRSQEWVIVGSHHDGPWASAVEDASGTSLVLAQAAYWSSVPRENRPHNLLFLLNAGHMAGGAGARAFVADHADLLDRVVLEVHLEHAARRCDVVGGELVPTDDPEVRWWFTSRNPDLERAVQAAIEANDLRRSLVFRPDVFFANPPTDGAFFDAAGVPVVQFLTAPMYLFDARDTVDKVHEVSLEPVSRAAIQIIESTRDVTAAAMRAGIVGRQ